MPLTLQPVIEGNDAGPTLVFVQGWPDDCSLWEPQLAVLAPRYRCVRMDMPGYGVLRDDTAGPHTDEIVEALAACVRQVSRGAPVTLVLHDWGCVWGHAMHNRYPELAARVVGLDVAPHFTPGPRAALGIVAYQSWLAAAFFLGGAIGDRMTRRMAKAAGAPMARERVHAGLNYPYRNIWQDLVSGRSRKGQAGYWPEVPLLFVYGKDKPFPFHSRRWVDHVTRSGGEVVGLDGGHWVSRNPAFNAILIAFLERTDRVLQSA